MFFVAQEWLIYRKHGLIYVFCCPRMVDLQETWVDLGPDNPTMVDQETFDLCFLTAQEWLIYRKHGYKSDGAVMVGEFVCMPKYVHVQ